MAGCHRIRWPDASECAVIGQRQCKPLTVKQLQRIIARPIYAGVLCEKWTSYQPVRAQYDGLVSIDTFNQANRGKVFIRERSDGKLQLFYDYSPNGKIRLRRLKNNPVYPYKSIILCAHCQKPFLGSASIGKLKVRYPAYHCSRDGYYLRIPKPEFEDNVDNYLAGVALKPWFLDELERELITAYEQRGAELRDNAERIRDNVRALEAEQSDMVASLIATKSAVAREKIEERIENLERRIEQARGHAPEIAVTKTDIHAFTQAAKKLMEHPEKTLKNNANMQKQARLAGLVFEQLPTYPEICNGTPKLSPVFALNQSFTNGKSLSVTPLSLEWNTWERMIQQWNGVFNVSDHR